MTAVFVTDKKVQVSEIRDDLYAKYKMAMILMMHKKRGNGLNHCLGYI